jgi:putative transcriptional regulator
MCYSFIVISGGAMDFSSINDKTILEELGTRIKRRRLALNISQLELMRKAGVARKVIQNIESGRNCSMKGFIRTMRALGCLGELDLFLPDSGLSPLELARLKGHKRQRASARRKVRNTEGGKL